MGKRTLEVNKERLALIEQHKKWAEQQKPLVNALITHSEGCLVFAPAPETRSESEFDHVWTVKHVVYVPSLYCEEAVTIPANHALVHGGIAHGMVFLTGVDPNMGDSRRRRFVTIDPELEIALPGGDTAKMRKTAAGYIVREASHV
jgi:hypothetical protein